MKKFIASIVFCLAFTPPIVRAVDWLPVSGDEEITLYVDVHSVKMKNGVIYFWSMSDFFPHLPQMPSTLSAKGFVSIIDCDLFSFQYLTTMFFSEHSGKGNVVSQFGDGKLEVELVEYAIPGSHQHHGIEWVCDFVKRQM